jgi:SAM-dependent methyltransferase
MTEKMPNDVFHVDPLRPLSIEQMTDLVVACFGWPREEVSRRLRREHACSGVNVAEDVIARGVPPFVWSDALALFYETTQAFVYELLIYNSQPERIQLRKTLLQIVSDEQSRRGRPVSVLLWGDGLGFDSLAVGLAFEDADVTYFEISDLSSQFAARMFRGHAHNVRVTRQLSEGDRGRYDVVAAIDVMEHVPDPQAWIADVATALRPGGVAVIKEAFDAVIASRPTHLKQSAWRFAYRTPRLFERGGFVTERYGNFPFLFRLGDGMRASLKSRLYYYLTTPLKQLLIVPRLLSQPDLDAFVRQCSSR